MSSSSLLSPPSPPPPAPLPLSSSPSLRGCPELDLSVTLSPAPKTVHTHLKPHLLKTSQQSEQSMPPRLQGQTRRKNSQVCFDERVVVTVTPEQSKDTLPQQPIRGQRRSRGCNQANTWWAEPPVAVTSQYPSGLEKAGLNTTLALKAELQSLQGAEFNSQKVLQETLQKSRSTKNLINTRATEEVNVSRSQLLFTSLVSVNVQQDQLISQLLPTRLTPPLPCHGNQTPSDGPSLLLFMTSDHLRQKSVPLEEEPVNYKPRPSTYPASSTFDLYRRGRC
ncbi:protein phosphatase 1 regulatory subunit 35 isoform X2 [Centropristis striata]|uniref:protein phosphatase 1 regulatory subunit 35 isoform X2 n=1 Tax=Centropristis striata TaxID=184440 RepID=UPI0027DEBB7B|nr:protein phosphatase 1 regulatory subunit 35 isoform X2 [Centropristis striata]